jgi:hypothetical protein
MRSEGLFVRERIKAGKLANFPDPLNSRQTGKVSRFPKCAWPATPLQGGHSSWGPVSMPSEWGHVMMYFALTVSSIRVVWVQPLQQPLEGRWNMWD